MYVLNEKMKFPEFVSYRNCANSYNVVLVFAVDIATPAICEVQFLMETVKRKCGESVTDDVVTAKVGVNLIFAHEGEFAIMSVDCIRLTLPFFVFAG